MIPSTTSEPAQRDVPLEALRGLAALAVVAWHFCLAFFPPLLGDPDYGIAAMPWFAFVHGTGAVYVFFVLSGYVLTKRYFETKQPRRLVVGALKRYFRLFLPVFLSIMLSWLLFACNLYFYEDAGRLSNSYWLATFGFAMHPPFNPNFAAALQDTFLEMIGHSDAVFNPLLWTIHIELAGSFIAFAFAAMLVLLRGHPLMIALISFIIALPLHFFEAGLTSFLLGTLLAFYASHLKEIKTVPALIFLALGLSFLGFRDPIGFYGWLDFLQLINGDTFRIYTSTIGAVFLMIAFIGWQPLRRALSGRIARWLGRLSFPIYLVHIIVIFSLGSYVFIAMHREPHAPAAIVGVTALAVLPAVLLLASVLAVIDIKWVAFVNRRFRQIKIAD